MKKVQKDLFIKDFNNPNLRFKIIAQFKQYMLDTAFNLLKVRRLKYRFKRIEEFKTILKNTKWDFQTKSDRIDYIIENDITYFGQNSGVSAKAMYQLKQEIKRIAAIVKLKEKGMTYKPREKFKSLKFDHELEGEARNG